MQNRRIIGIIQGEMQELDSEIRKKTNANFVSKLAFRDARARLIYYNGGFADNG